jgi:hypothetical protein
MNGHGAAVVLTAAMHLVLLLGIPWVLAVAHRLTNTAE